VAILRDILNPATAPQFAVASRRRRNMMDPNFYDPQDQQQQQFGSPTDSTVQNERNFADEPVTGNYILTGLQKMAQRKAPPSLEPGSRVRTADLSQTGPDNFKSFYDMLGSVNQRGQEMLGAAQAQAAYKRQQAAAALANQQVAGFTLPTLNGSGSYTGGGSAPAGKGVQRWAPITLQVMKELGIPESYLPAILRRMNQESGGNPTVQNNWDSNAKKGTPSIGLMQTIGPTFNAYAGPYRGRGITDPYANIYAGLNYAGQRYGKSHGGFLGGVLYAMNKSGGY